MHRKVPIGGITPRHIEGCFRVHINILACLNEESVVCSSAGDSPVSEC